jgi:hypothetical protein
MRLVECTHCGGDKVVTVVTGGRFSMAQEQWYPDEHEEVCTVCDGTGSEFVEDDDDL